MRIKIVDRKYPIGRWLRFLKMQGVQLIGYKLAIYKYELRIYLN